MSATMDADHFSQYFQAEVLYLEGRSYPVEVIYLLYTRKYSSAEMLALYKLKYLAWSTKISVDYKILGIPC